MTLWTHERLRPKNWKGTRVRWKQFKYNGHRFTVYKQKNSRLVGFEREIRDDLEMTIKRPQIVTYDWWKALEQIPPMSSVDGELYVLHGHRCGNAGDAAHAIAECLPNLEFMPFAVPWWNDVNMFLKSLDDSQLCLKHRTGLRFASFFPLYDHETFESLCKDAEDLGVEGWVLKEANYLGWWKAKPTRPVDAIITRLKWSESDRYIGAIASAIVSVYVNDELVEIANVPGSSFDDATRWNIDEKDIGRVIQIQYQELGNGKRLIHSRFDGWRDDKPAKQCTYDWEDL